LVSAISLCGYFVIAQQLDVSFYERKASISIFLRLQIAAFSLPQR